MPLQPQRWRRVTTSSTLEMVAFCFSSHPSTHLLFSCLLLWNLNPSPRQALNFYLEKPPMMPSARKQVAQKAAAGCTSPRTRGTFS